MNASRRIIHAWTSSNGALIDLNQFLPGSSIFLIAGGPSLNRLDLDSLKGAGILTIGLNNSPATFRPDWWISVDNPDRFLTSIWLDPGVLKLVRQEHRDSPLFDPISKCRLNLFPSTCPGVVFFASNLDYSEDSFLTDDSICWGSASQPGGRSVLLAALKNLFHFGVRNVFLLGVDFRMEPGNPYHFPESRTPEMAEMNNQAYQVLSERLKGLQPEFLRHGFHVWNCNVASKLSAFPFLEYELALEKARESFPSYLEDESTEGRYVEMSPANSSAGIFNDRKSRPDQVSVRRVDRSKRPHVTEASSIARGDETPADCEVILLADRDQQWLLPWWWHHFQSANRRLGVTVYSKGMSGEAISWAESKGLAVQEIGCRLPDGCATWFYKPFAIRQSQKKRVVFCDLDCEVRGSLLPLFHWCKEGITLGQDLHPVGRHRKLFREGCYFNSGLIAVDPKADIIRQWGDEIERLHGIMRSDQEILNLTLYEQETLVVSLPEHFHQLRLDGDHEDAKVMHWTGPDGKAHIRRAMSALKLPPLS